MTQTEEREAVSASTAVERVEHLASQAGERLGRLVGRTALRFQHVTQVARKEAAERGTPAGREPRATGVQDQAPVTERAEGLVGQFEQGMSHWSRVGNQRAKRILARLREDAEDVWVDAQEMRGGWKKKRG